MVLSLSYCESQRQLTCSLCFLNICCVMIFLCCLQLPCSTKSFKKSIFAKICFCGTQPAIICTCQFLFYLHVGLGLIQTYEVLLVIGQLLRSFFMSLGHLPHIPLLHRYCFSLFTKKILIVAVNPGLSSDCFYDSSFFCLSTLLNYPL